MKVTFILPSVGRMPGRPYVRSWLMEPLAIGALSALTPPDVERVFHDDRLEPIPFDAPTDLVALSVETYTARRAYQIAAAYRRRGVPVVMGGFHPTLAPEDAATEADAVVIGEAEGVWPALLADAASGRLQRVYRAGDGPPPPMATPDRSIFAGRPYVKLTLVEAGRGCPHTCEFCAISPFFRRRHRNRPVEEIVAEIRAAGRRPVFFVDDNLCADRGHARRLFEALAPLRRRWVGQVSLDATRDEGLLARMRASGCAGVLIGLESLDPEGLAAMGKAVNGAPADYAGALARLRRHGLAVYGTFVFGYDGDTPATLERAFRFAVKHRLFFAAFNHLVPFPGTALHARLESEGRLRRPAWWRDPAFRFGDVAFRPAGFTPGGLADACFAFRRRFYGPTSVLRRARDPRANARTPFMTALFLAQNLGAGRDARLRQGLPLGFPEA